MRNCYIDILGVIWTYAGNRLDTKAFHPVLPFSDTNCNDTHAALRLLQAATL
jgi:hypothetical protein